MPKRAFFVADIEKTAVSAVFFVYLRFCVFGLDDLYSVIESTSLTHMVGTSVFATMGAFYKSGSLELPNVRTSLISACFRSFRLRYCHGNTSYVCGNPLCLIYFKTN